MQGLLSQSIIFDSMRRHWQPLGKNEGKPRCFQATPETISVLRSTAPASIRHRTSHVPQEGRPKVQLQWHPYFRWQNWLKLAIKQDSNSGQSSSPEGAVQWSGQLSSAPFPWHWTGLFLLILCSSVPQPAAWGLHPPGRHRLQDIANKQIKIPPFSSQAQKCKRKQMF